MEWGYQPVDPQKYVAMLRAVYPAIKAANPAVQVLAGALAPTLAPPGNPDGMNDLAYLQAMYDGGAAANFDILAIHAAAWLVFRNRMKRRRPGLSTSVVPSCCGRSWSKMVMARRKQ
ncbi:MAG: hypothetical protein R2932_15970 [Caldilineaceae bacterium]